MKSKLKFILPLIGLIVTAYYLGSAYKETDAVVYYDTALESTPTRFEKKHHMLPSERYKVRQEMIYKENGPNYQPGYQQKELKKALKNSNSMRLASYELMERGPSNVPGRARGLIVLPQDETHNTWLVGSSGGGIWKTTDGGMSWSDMSPDFPTLAITSLAYCESNPDIIYAGSGEYIASAYTAINGDGLFKSTDAGETWTQLESTSGNSNFQSVTRVVVHPSNPDIVLASTAPNTWGSFVSHIMKSVDGGATWTSVFEARSGAIEQLVYEPDNFNRIYAAQNGVGVLASDDQGDTWKVISKGLAPSGRIEIAISPVDNSRLYAAAVGGLDNSQEADIYYSSDYGVNWTLIKDPLESSDVLGGQGWYDNTVLAHPFNLNEFYIGGVGLYKYEVDVNAELVESEPTFLGAEENGTQSFMGLVNYTNGVFYGNRIGQGDADAFTSIEIRFGPGKSQKAHRYVVPTGQGAGVDSDDYDYVDYVDVPFEVWDMDADPPRQLMIGFRDQQRDGKFNLISQQTTSSDADLHSREYLYFNNITYNSSTPNSSMAKNGGQEFQNMYFLWPFLQQGGIWDDLNLPESTFNIFWGTTISGEYAVSSVADPYADFDGKNNNVHPDHHNLVAVIHDEVAKEFQLVNVNDGASYATKVSTTPGSIDDDWYFAGSMMNTTQFYGADKAPGVDRYVGGAQDNGSWVSAVGEIASKTTEWKEGWGGDGFDAVWHPTDINKIIVTSQNLNIGRSTDGGVIFGGATEGMEDSSPPFIGQFANAPQKPDVVFTIGADGVYRSDNFAGSWKLVDMRGNTDWSSSSLMSIEISDMSPDVIWAGTRILGSNGSLFLSTNGGRSFNAVPDNDGLNSGIFTGIGTSVHDHKEVYLLFSYADSPKVLRSMDLGQSWEDISGFDASSSSSGFPDVAVYDIQVMPHDRNIIWVGTEIGIVESIDNGSSWHLLESNMPRAAVWKIKLKDDQLVLATHGRGIWTYTLPEKPKLIYGPQIINASTTVDNQIGVSVDYLSSLDSVHVKINGEAVETQIQPEVGSKELIYEPDGSNTYQIQMIGYLNGASFTGKVYSFELIEYATSQNTYQDKFNTDLGNFNGDMLITSYSGFPSQAIHTPHSYESNSDVISYLSIPIVIDASNSTIRYKDVAIVEPEKDYVTIEGSTDGINWVTVAKYDASENEAWLSTFESEGNGTQQMYVSHEYDLLTHFNPGDVVVFRFRLSSDDQNEAWGWVIDDLYIQSTILGSEDFVSDLISVYPNPTTDFVNIDIKSISKVELFDNSGRKLSAKLKGNQLDMRSLKSGVYLMKIITTDGKTQTVRVKKQ